MINDSEIQPPTKKPNSKSKRKRKSHKTNKKKTIATIEEHEDEDYNSQNNSDDEDMNYNDIKNEFENMFSSIDADNNIDLNRNPTDYDVISGNYVGRKLDATHTVEDFEGIKNHSRGNSYSNGDVNGNIYSNKNDYDDEQNQPVTADIINNEYDDHTTITTAASNASITKERRTADTPEAIEDSVIDRNNDNNEGIISNIKSNSASIINSSNDNAELRDQQLSTNNNLSNSFNNAYSNSSSPIIENIRSNLSVDVSTATYSYDRNKFSTSPRIDENNSYSPVSNNYEGYDSGNRQNSQNYDSYDNNYNYENQSRSIDKNGNFDGNGYGNSYDNNDNYDNNNNYYHQLIGTKSGDNYSKSHSSVIEKNSTYHFSNSVTPRSAIDRNLTMTGSYQDDRNISRDNNSPAEVVADYSQVLS